MNLLCQQLLILLMLTASACASTDYLLPAANMKSVDCSACDRLAAETAQDPSRNQPTQPKVNQPHVCLLEDIVAKGKDESQARTFLRKYLDQQKRKYDESRVRCQADYCFPDDDVITEDIYPTSCAYNGKKFRGINESDAWRSLKKYICLEPQAVWNLKSADCKPEAKD